MKKIIFVITFLFCLAILSWYNRPKQPVPAPVVPVTPAQTKDEDDDEILDKINEIQKQLDRINNEQGRNCR